MRTDSTLSQAVFVATEPDWVKPATTEVDWGKLTEAVRHAAFDHQTETHNRNEIWGNYQLAEDRYQATAKRLDDALKALAAAVKQLEKDGENDGNGT